VEWAEWCAGVECGVGGLGLCYRGGLVDVGEGAELGLQASDVFQVGGDQVLRLEFFGAQSSSDLGDGEEV